MVSFLIGLQTIRKIKKTFNFELSILDDYIIVIKNSEVDGTQSNPKVFKIALSEF